MYIKIPINLYKRIFRLAKYNSMTFLQFIEWAASFVPKKTQGDITIVDMWTQFLKNITPAINELNIVLVEKGMVLNIQVDVEGGEIVLRGRPIGGEKDVQGV